MGYLAPGEIFENMLQLKLLVYILNSKWLLSYRNNDISYRDAKGSDACFPRNFLNDWCNLVSFDVLL